MGLINGTVKRESKPGGMLGDADKVRVYVSGEEPDTNEVKSLVALGVFTTGTLDWAKTWSLGQKLLENENIFNTAVLIPMYGQLSLNSAKLSECAAQAGIPELLAKVHELGLGWIEPAEKNRNVIDDGAPYNIYTNNIDPETGSYAGFDTG